MTRRASSTSRSACPNAGTTSPPLQDQVGVGVTEHQDVEVRHAAAAYRASGPAVVPRRNYDVDVPRIVLVQGDITVQDVDAVVNAANTALRPGGGVDGAITRAAGPDALADRERVIRERGNPPLPTGEAVATIGGALAARWIIHTAGPIYSGSPDDPRLLASCHTRMPAGRRRAGGQDGRVPRHLDRGLRLPARGGRRRSAIDAVASGDTDVDGGSRSCCSTSARWRRSTPRSLIAEYRPR